MEWILILKLEFFFFQNNFEIKFPRLNFIMGEYSGRTVILSSSDDKQFEVPVEVASLSVTIKHMMEGTEK